MSRNLCIEIVHLKGYVSDRLDKFWQVTTRAIAHPLDAERATLIVSAMNIISVKIGLSWSLHSRRNSNVMIFPHVLILINLYRHTA